MARLDPTSSANSGEVEATLERVRAALSSGRSVRLSTSGTTGQPTAVDLSARALRASAEATASRLGGVGRWVLALPVDHVAGLQVLVRSELAATAGVANSLVAPQHGSAAVKTPSLVELLNTALAPNDAKVFVSIVPTQLRRALANPTCAAHLAACTAVLVGGGLCPPALLQAARAAGINAVLTYGMTETAGGCVYDGVPLDGVKVRIANAENSGVGRIEISGPVLADGLGPWFRTKDLGRLDETGRLTIFGRSDEVIVTGGINVHPGPVAAVLSQALGGVEVFVLGVPHPDWGEAVTAIVTGKFSPDELAAARARTAAELGPIATPKQILRLPSIPTLSSGKPDRERLRAIAANQADLAR